MSDVILGKIITTNPVNRDAIHVAIVPALAAQELSPGDHVNLRLDGSAEKSLVTIGVVDPFLRECVLKGEQFWLLLYPNTVTAMRHHFSHPALDEIDKLGAVSKSKTWIEWFAKTIGNTYEDVMLAARSETTPESAPTVFYDLDSYIYDIPEEFWHHYEVITGVVVENKDKIHGFTCRC